MSLKSKSPERKKFAQRLNSLENNNAKRRKKNTTFLNIDKNVNSFINSKNYDILKYKKFPYFRRKKNYFNYDYKKYSDFPLSFDIRNNEEKKKLIKEINRSYIELRLQNKEMKKYKDLYGTIKEQNKTNQYILDQIINEEREKVDLKNNSNQKTQENNRSKSENDIIITAINSEKKKEEPLSDKNSDKIEPLSNRDTDKKDFFLTKTLIMSKQSRKDLFSKTSRGSIIKNNLLSPKTKGNKILLNYMKNKQHLSKINFLKKELIYYDKAIDKDNKKLEVFKKNEKISKYIQAQNELDLQNKELEDLIKLYNEYQKKIKEYSAVIYFYQIKNDNYVSIINNINNKIEKNFQPTKDNWEQDIPKMETDKKSFEDHFTLYKSENDKIKKENEELKKKEKTLIEFIENNLNYLKERNKNNDEINNTYIIEQKLRKKLELKNTKMEKAKKINDELNDYINKTAFNKKYKLEEKIKNEQNEQEKIKKINKEIISINREIQKNNYQNDVEDNEMEMEINSKNDFIKEQIFEIEKLNVDEELLNEEINELNNELKLISNKINEKNNELKKLVN